MQKNKLIELRILKNCFAHKTKKSQLLKIGDIDFPDFVWLPFSLISITSDNLDNQYNLIAIPEWLLMQNKILFEFISIL